MSRDSGAQLKQRSGLSEHAIRSDTEKADQRQVRLAARRAARLSGRRRSPLKSAWQALVLVFLRVLMMVSAIVPMRLLLRVGAGLGSLAYLIGGRYRRVGLKNLRLVYGDALRDRERRRITRAVFSNFGKSAVEFASGAAGRKATILRWSSETMRTPALPARSTRSGRPADTTRSGAAMRRARSSGT